MTWYRISTRHTPIFINCNERCVIHSVYSGSSLRRFLYLNCPGQSEVSLENVKLMQQHLLSEEQSMLIFSLLFNNHVVLEIIL